MNRLIQPLARRALMPAARALLLLVPFALWACSSDEKATSGGQGGAAGGGATGQGAGPGPSSGSATGGTGGVVSGTGGSTSTGGTTSVGGAGGGAQENTDALCSDSLDNDGDSYVDCDDFDCKAPGLTACQENCSNGVDDDGDGNVDCADRTCNGMNGGAIDPACMGAATMIQDVQDGTVSVMATVSIANVFVTAAHTAASGTVTLYVQEPDGVTTAGHTYPEFAGIEVFANATTAAMFPDMATVAVGDCVSFSGTVTEFHVGTEIGSLTAFAKSMTACGTPPTPFVIPSAAVTFANIATDIDAATTGDQPGSLAETYEGVLVEVDGVAALPANATDPAGDFRVSHGGAENLLIDKFLYAPAAPTAGQTFSKIVGIYAQFDNYRINPRSAADLTTP